MLNDTVGMTFGVIPAARSARKKAMLLSPLIVLKMTSGFVSDDLPDGGVDVGAAQQDVLLADHLAAQRLHVVADDRVRHVRKHVIGADQKDAPPDRVERPLHGRDDLLVRRGARVDDVGRRLQPLVLHRIEEQVVVLLDDRLDHLPAGRGPAAEDDADVLVDDQVAGQAGEGRPVGTAVDDHRLDAAAEQAAGGVDLVDGHQRGARHRGFADGHRSGLRVEDADADRRLGPAGGRARAMRRRRDPPRSIFEAFPQPCSILWICCATSGATDVNRTRNSPSLSLFSVTFP